MVDDNKLQASGYTKDILHIKKTSQIVNFFDWNVEILDGHNATIILKKISQALLIKKPSMLFCQTVKGRGVSFMENNPNWHHRNLNEEEYNRAISELLYEK